MRKKFTMLFAALLACAGGAKAQVSDGIYSIQSRSESGTSLWANGGKIYTKATDVTDYTQLWYIQKNEDADTYIVMNVNDASYLTPNKTASSQWTTNLSASDLYIGTPNNEDGTTATGYSYISFDITTITSADNRTSLHNNGWTSWGYSNSYGVTWNAVASASHWTLVSQEAESLAAYANESLLVSMIAEAETLAANIVLTGTDELTGLTTAKENAQTVADETDAAVVFSAVHALKSAIDAANAYIDNNTLYTVDKNNPILVRIKTARANNPYWTYKKDGGNVFKIRLETLDESSLYQLWVLMKDEDSNVLLYPYADPDNAMGYNNSSNGADKITNYNPSTIALRLDASSNSTYPYEFKTANASNIVSNYGGTDSNLGFYSTSDEGSIVALEVVEDFASTKSYAYRQLMASVNRTSAIYVAGTEVGEYSEAAITGLTNGAIADANTVLETADATDDACTTAKSNIETAVTALAVNMPEAGKFYNIRSANTYRSYVNTTALIYVNADNAMKWANSYDATTTNGIWEIYPNENGTAYIAKNVHTGEYINNRAMSKDAGELSLAFLGDRQFTISGGGMFHAQGSGNSIAGWDCSWDNQVNKDNASAWIIDEVAVADIKHLLSVGDAGWASLVLGFNATIPSDVTLYTVSNVAGGYATLTEVEGTVLPANTPVLVEAAKNDYEFAYTDAEATAVEGNLLAGKAYNTYLEQVEGTTNYVLSYQAVEEGGESVVGLFKKTAYDIDLSNDDDEKDEEGNVTTAVNDHITFAANKAYLPVTTAGEAAQALRIRKGSEEGTTSIDNAQLTNDNEVVIYDLAGRRVQKMEKGIYIVNGKKVIR